MMELHITHMNNDHTVVEFGEDKGPIWWKSTHDGLFIKLSGRGSRRIFPWVTVKSYTVVVSDNGEADGQFIARSRADIDWLQDQSDRTIQILHGDTRFLLGEIGRLRATLKSRDQLWVP